MHFWRRQESYLLPEADAWAGVKWQEDERILRDVFLEARVQETVGVEFFRWKIMSINAIIDTSDHGIPSGPQRSVRLCIMKTEYAVLCEKNRPLIGAMIASIMRSLTWCLQG